MATAADWLSGISPEGFGTVAMLVNVIIALTVSRLTKPTPQEVQDLVETIRYPRGVGNAIDH